MADVGVADPQAGAPGDVGAGPGQPAPPPLPGREYGLRDIVVLVATLGAAVVLVLWAALGVWPFAGSGMLWVLGVLVVVGVNVCFGALLAGGYIEIFNQSWSRLGALDHVVMGVSLLAILAAEIALSWWLLTVTQSWWRWGYVVVAPVCIVAGAAWSWSSMWPRSNATERPSGWSWPGMWVISGIVGAGFGVALAILTILGLAYYRNNYSVPSAAPPKVPVVTGITGSYVAVGDSYSAGEGLRPFLPGTAATGCDQSHLAYSQLLVFSQGRTDKSFTACSGAVTADVYSPRASGPAVPPQLDGKVHPDVGLVTLTIGGNNVLFSKIVIACFEKSNCLKATFPPKGSGDGPEGVKPGPLASSWAPATALKVGQDDAVLFTRLRTDFPNARIVVIGYPYLFPAEHAGLVPNDCASVLRRFSYDERAGIRHLEDQFNDLTYEEAVAAHIEFVSSKAMWQDHEPCGTKGQYTNSIKPFLSFHNPVDGGTFHPNKEGQQTLAALVACYLDSYPSPPNPYAGGQSVSLDISTTKLETPADLGLVTAPGFTSAPTKCA